MKSVNRTYNISYNISKMNIDKRKNSRVCSEVLYKDEVPAGGIITGIGRIQGYVY
jgi:hypothetical protein